MPDLKKTLVFYEGDDDKAFLEKLQEAELLPQGWQLANRDKTQHLGKEGLLRQLLPVASPVNGIDGRAVVLVDLDDLTPAQTRAWFCSGIEKVLQHDPKYAAVSLQIGDSCGSVQAIQLVSGERMGRIALIPVGHLDGKELNEQYQIDRFAIDDWIFRLALNRAVFESVGDFIAVDYDTAVRKYTEVAVLFRKNGLEVRKAKTYLQILRALAAIRPSTATIVGRLVHKAIEVLGKEGFITLTKPFLDDLAAADKLLEA